MSDLATLGFKVNTRGLARGESSLDSFARKGRKTEAQVSRSSKGIVNSFRSIEISVGTLAKTFALIQGLNIGRDIIRMSDSWMGLNSQIRQVIDSEDDQLRTQKELIALSKETRSGLVETTKLYAELTRSTSNLDISQNRILGVTKTLNNLFMSGGRPISEINGAIRQLSQGFAAGTLRGDEFNSVAENAPRIMDALGQHLNMTRGQLREFAATGGITAQIMIDAIEKYSEQAQTLADKTEQTFGQSMQIAETNILTFIGNADAITDTVTWLGRSIADLTDYFAVFAASGQLEATLDLISSKFNGLMEDIDAVAAMMTKEPSFWTSFADEGEIAFGRIWQASKDTFVNMPENIRAFIKIATVELASIVDVGTAYFSLLGRAIGVQLAHLPNVASAHITAFGQVLGTELAKYVTIAGAYGQELVDKLNPFDGDTFNLDAAIANAEKIASGMTDTYLAEAERQVAGSEAIQEELMQQYVNEANAKIEASRNARAAVITDIMNERDAAIASSDEQIEAIGAMGDAYRQLEKDRLASIGEGAGTGTKKTPTEDQIKDLAKLVKSVDKFGGAWKKTGSVIVDAFGSIADQLNDYSKQLKEITKNEKDLAKMRDVFGKDNAEIIMLEEQLQAQRTEAELRNMRNIADATGSMFKEKTAASKAFAALSKMITVAEIAMSYQKMAAGTAEATTHVANETVKQESNALSAITSAFSAPFPVNFVAGAAMIAIMAGLLGTTFGGGGGGAGNGTGTAGTAMGGGVSESLSKANEGMEDILVAQLAELRGLRSDLSKVDNLAFGLFRQLLAVDPGHHEIRNSTEAALRNSFSGLNTGGNTGPYTKTLRNIFGSIGDSITEAVDILGITATRSISSFVFRVGEISFDDLSAEEAEKRLNQILSAQSDLMVQSVAPFITEYQQLGEGALETLVRVAKEQAIFNDTIRQLGVDLSAFNSYQQITIAQDLIDAIGGMDKFTDATTYFFENFFSEQEQFEVLQQSIADVFTSLGLSMVHTKEDFRALIESIDITTASGQEMWALLMEIAPAMADYTDALDEQQEAFLENIEEMEDAAKRSLKELENAIDAQKEVAKSALDAAEAQYEAEATRLDNLRSSLDEELALRQEKRDEAESALRASYTAEINLIRQNSEERLASLAEEKKSLSTVASSMRSLIQGVKGAIGVSTSSVLEQAFKAAQLGDFSLAKDLNLSKLATLDPRNFASAEEFRIQQAVNQNRIASIGALAGDELTATEAALQAADLQIAAIKEQTDAQIEVLNNQMNSLLGIDTGVAALNDAINAYQTAQSNLNDLNYTEQLSRLDMLVASNEEVYTAATKYYEDEINRLDGILSTNEEMLNAALGIEDSVLSVEVAINELVGAIDNLAIAQAPTTTSPQEVTQQQTNTVDNTAVLEAVKEGQRQSELLMLEIVRNTKTSAKALQQFQFDGLDTRIIP